MLRLVSYLSQMISTLAIFLTPSERQCCLYLDNMPRTYQKDVLIQGFVKVRIRRPFEATTELPILSESAESSLKTNKSFHVRIELPTVPGSAESFLQLNQIFINQTLFMFAKSSQFSLILQKVR